MKAFVTLALSLVSVSAFAQTAGKPFQLPAGNYTEECWSTYVSQKDGEEPMRLNSYDKSTLKVMTLGDVSYTISKTESSSVGWSETSETVEKTFVTDLGNGLFKRVSDLTISTTSDGKTKTQQQTAEASLKVTGNVTRTLSVKQNSNPEKESTREASWETAADGKIIWKSYLIAPQAKTSSKGVPYQVLVNNYLCLITTEAK